MHSLLRLPYIATIVGGVVFLLGMVGLGLLLALHVHNLTQAEANALRKRVMDVTIQRSDFLRQMAYHDLDDCGEKSLQTLRFGLFRHYLLNDAIIFEPNSNRIVCSSMLGELKGNFVLPESDKHLTEELDTYVWINPENIPYMQDAFTLVFRKGNVGTILFDSVYSTIGIGFEFAAFRRLPDGKLASFSGRDDLIEDFQAAERNIFKLVTFSHACMADPYGVCFLVRWRDPLAPTKIGALLVGGTLANLALAFAALGFVRHTARTTGDAGARIKASIRAGGRGLECHYQPIVSASDGRVVGCEVLARFGDEHGILSPLEFVPEVKRLKLTWAFTEIILSRALKELEPVTSGRRDFRVSINFFPDDLTDYRIDALLQSPGLRHARETHVPLCFEILESEVQSWQQMSRFHAFARECNFQIAIDDFGTGFSNLAQVRQSNADLIKIDRSFICELGQGEQAMRASLVQPIIDIARSVDARIVAEGVETAEQRKILQKLGVDFLQGFYFSRPLPIGEFRDYIWRTNRHRSSSVVQLRST